MIVGVSGCKKELPTNENTKNDATSVEKMVPEDGASLVLWTGNKAYGKAIADAFEKKYNIPVAVEEQGMGTINKMALCGPSKEGADVFIAASDNFEQGLSSGVFMKLDDVVAKEVKTTVAESAITAVTNEGTMYGVPISIEVLSMYYNKDLVTTPATKLEDIMEQAKEYNDVANNRFFLLCTIGDGYYEFPFLTYDGFQLFGEHGTDKERPGFDTQAYENGLSLISKLKETIPITSTDLNNKSSVKAAFMNGDVAYYISGPWDVAQVKESGINFGITTLPTYQEQQLRPFSGIQIAHVSTFTDYPVAAQLLANFLISEEGASILYEEYDGITTRKDIRHVKGLSEDAYLTPFVEQFKNSIPMPSISRISYWWKISQDIDKAVFDQQLTPSQGRTKAMEHWNSLIQVE